jgi:type I restriction enzyme, S subunit
MEVRKLSPKYLTRPRSKQTEVGVIPEDWDAVPLGDLGKFKNGINKDSDSFGHGSPFVNLMDVFGVSRITSNDGLGLVASNAQEQQTYDLRKGDVVFIRSSVKPSGVGLTALVERDLPSTVFSGFLIRYRDKGKLSDSFKRHCFYEDGFRRRMISASSVSANTNISQDNLKRLFLALPPTKEEQEAIAEALSDADALIESLEQLLAKKRWLKQGAMQELLNGKRRLPGFNGEWRVKRLDELGRWTGGMTPSMRNPRYWQSGTVPWISSGDVKSVRLTTTAYSISDYAVKQRTTTLLPAKSIIVVTRSGILRKYLPVAMNMIPMAINQDIKALLPNDLVLPEFLLHSLICNGDRILARCLKSGTTVESIEFPWLKAFTIPIPKPLEQTAIAAILSDMDAEIVALVEKLAKTRRIKQGMMQDILTGRVRLI